MPENQSHERRTVGGLLRQVLSHTESVPHRRYPVALNKHGTLPVAPFVSMLRASFVHGFRSGPSANEEKLVTRAGYAPGLWFPC